jgi:hypothetical protein
MTSGLLPRNWVSMVLISALAVTVGTGGCGGGGGEDPPVEILLQATMNGGAITLERDTSGRVVLPITMEGTAYDVELQAAGGNGSYSWSCSGCAREFTPGVQIVSTGSVTGTASLAGEVCPTFVVRSGTRTDTEEFCLRIFGDDPNHLTPEGPLDGSGRVVLPNAVVGRSYANPNTGQSVVVGMTGGERPPYLLEDYAGSLPPGLSLTLYTDEHGAYARLTGAPNNPGTFFFGMRGSDAMYSTHQLVDPVAGTMIQRIFSVTVIDCADSLMLASACAAGLPNECTCAASDPCVWAFDGTCQEGCQQFYQHFDDQDCE